MSQTQSNSKSPQLERRAAMSASWLAHKSENAGAVMMTLNSGTLTIFRADGTIVCELLGVHEVTLNGNSVFDSK